MRDEDVSGHKNGTLQGDTAAHHSSAVRALSFLAILWHLSLAQEEKRLLGVP